MRDPASLRVVCPACAKRLWARRRGEMTLGGKILRYDESTQRFTAVCDCGEAVPVPFLRIEAPPVRRRLVVSVES